MTIDLRHAHIHLAARQPLRLSQARGTRLRMVAGTGWVTIDGDRRDWVLEPGDELVVDSATPVLVTGLGGDITVDVCNRPRPRPAASGLIAWLARTWPSAPTPRGAAA